MFTQIKIPYLLIIFFVFFGFAECKKTNTTTQKSTSSINLPAGFKEFYQKFHSDSIFQMQHIVFPVEGLKRMNIEGKDTILSYTYPESEWRMNHLFDTSNADFNQSFYLPDENTVIDKITGTKGVFCLERRFANLSDGWNLIYYAEY